MPISPRVTARHVLPCVAVMFASLLCGGCAGQHTAAHRAEAGAPAPTSTARPASLQDIATALGCTAEIMVDAEELREGACGAGEDAYRMLTFAADQGQKAWLDESRNYGGTYLVGNRWVVVAASADALAPLKERLGGTVETGTSHSGSSHSGASEAGTPEAGTPQAGTPESGSPESGTPEAGNPDAGSPHSGSPHGGHEAGGGSS
ncbi:MULTISPECIES: hypothetical protein [unclassified Streptomyces]|uniref:hypothetical protein n=1 Tax=unclassified Streptomyces TaxID=2593676 RepID=UPI00225166FE|nr:MULTISPECIES: hypothetical protein [unclassified Streptomyces]MCX4529386.1 hypothetical protein [Streptomyces sp. NBC_01551]MCX4540074.1 hypothetical protein [Streptomyces sp. NBC_01565]